MSNDVVKYPFSLLKVMCKFMFRERLEQSHDTKVLGSDHNNSDLL